MMTQEDYNNLVSSLVNQLLEEGPKVAAEGDKEGATTPDVPDEEPIVNKFQTKNEPKQRGTSSLAQTAKEHPVLTAGALGGADEALGLLNKIFGYHHFGSHAALKGHTSGTGEG